MQVEDILHHLAMAYGGHSQYPLEAVADAIVGQINNNGLQGDPVSLADEAAICLSDRFGDGFECDDAAELILNRVASKLNKAEPQ